MELLLTALSALALLVFLGALLVALGRIRSALEGVQHSMMRIAWGVRAIEAETAPLDHESRALLETADRLAGGVEAITSRLASADGRLAALGALRREPD